MKKKVMNIRPQEVTENGERSVRYKGSDGKMHDVSAKLPQDAVIPISQRTVITAGEEITLAQAHAIEGFDFNKVSALSFGEGFNVYNGFYVNVDDSGVRYMTFLEYAYPGSPRVMFNKEGNEYTAFNGSSYNTILNFSDQDSLKSALAEVLLEIAKQTGFLKIYKYSNPVFLPDFYEEVVLLTLAEDIIVGEEFFMPTSSGGLVKLATVQDESQDDEEEPEVESFPYRVQNNPNAYEIFDSGEYTYNGQKLYKAKTCDGTETLLAAKLLYEILLNDPNTTVVYKDTRPGSAGTSIAILQTVQHDESAMCVRLHGELLGNTKATYNIYVYGSTSENRISVDKTTT